MNFFTGNPRKKHAFQWIWEAVRVRSANQHLQPNLKRVTTVSLISFLNHSELAESELAESELAESELAKSDLKAVFI